MVTPDQRRRNRRTGLILAVFVVAVFAYVIVKRMSF